MRSEATKAVWHGCYDDGWKGLIVDDAFAHPAKFARSLITRIYGYLFDRGWLLPDCGGGHNHFVAAIR